MIIIVENHNPNFMSWIIFLFLSSSIEWIKIKIDRKQGPDYADHQDKKIYFANEKIISAVCFLHNALALHLRFYFIDHAIVQSKVSPQPHPIPQSKILKGRGS